MCQSMSGPAIRVAPPKESVVWISQSETSFDFSVLMVDEAHERSLQTDMALGLLKKVLKKRKDLRLIVSSATLDAQVLVLYT